MHRPSRTLRLLSAFALVAWAASARAEGELQLDAPLPTDPALVTGTLENGLSYVFKRCPNPEGKVSVWLHVSSGSLNETDAQRGIAHFLEHMAFNGSEHFPPGTVVHYFESLGLSFGSDQNAFTTFDQTTYQLALPDTTTETLGKGLLFLSDVAYGLTLTPKEIDAERAVILEEKRTRSGARQRLQEAILPLLAPESTLGHRLPIGTAETINAVTEKDFRDYYGHWYVPSNMTVIAVGDCDPEPVVAAIRESFGRGKTVPAPADRAVGVVAPKAPRAIVLTDAEITDADLSLLAIAPPRAPSRTVGDLRAELVDAIGAWIFNRRIGTELAEGRAPFLSANCSQGDFAGAAYEATVSASGRADAWPAMLTALCTDLQRARLHGFTDRELADARAALLAGAETAVKGEATRPARGVLMQINASLTAGEPLPSATQQLELMQKLLPTITASEVSAEFRADYDFTNAAFLLTLPASAEIPTEEAFLAAGLAALDVQPAAETEQERATALLDELPKAGEYVEKSVHEATAVSSALLGNGVLVHHRAMDVQKNAASVTITLAGGVIEETAATRGLTEAGTLAWRRPATSKLTSTEIRDLMTGKRVGVGGGPGTDTLTLVVSGDPAELETGMQLAYLMLTDPVLEAAALEQWKQAQTQGIARRGMSPQGVFGETFADAIFPAGEVRTRSLDQAQVDAVTREAAEAWLRRICASAPIEVCVVGDIDAERAFDLAARYLGALGKRERISKELFADLRKLERPKGPIHVHHTMESKTQQAIVVDGFYGVDGDDIANLRPLFLASRILSTRLLDSIREEQGLVYSIGAGSNPATEFPGFGLFAAQAPCDPAKAEALVAALDVEWTKFAKEGPTEQELTVVRTQIANMLGQTLKQPQFWTQKLATLAYRGQSLDDIAEMAPAYASIDAETIRTVFARFCVPENRFDVAVVPVQAPAGGDGAAGEGPAGAPGDTK